MIIDLVREFEAGYYDKINLVASENLSSPNVREATRSDLAHRYSLRPQSGSAPAMWPYPNQEVQERIREETCRLACKLFHAGHVDVSTGPVDSDGDVGASVGGDATALQN